MSGIDRGINELLNIIWCRGLTALVSFIETEEDDDGDRALGEIGD